MSSNISSTPAIEGVDKAWFTCQDKVLDVICPMARIFDLAEAARLEDAPIDPEILSLWSQRAFCLLGNASAAITHKRRKVLLLKLDPKLANLAPLDPGIKAKGLFFGNSFIKEMGRYVTAFTSLDKAQQNIQSFQPTGFCQGR